LGYKLKRKKTPGGLWKVCSEIPREKAKLLEEIAKKEKISRSELLSIIIDLYLKGIFDE